MKLSNQQVGALAGKIREEIYKIKVLPVKDANQKVYDSEIYKNFEKNDSECKTLREFEHKYELSNFDINVACRKIKAKYFESQIKNIPNINIDDIINEIHLATIDAISVTAIVEAVTAKFK